MNEFIGKYLCTIDSKGRINLPAKIRKALSLKKQESLYIMPGSDDGSLFLYSRENFLKKIREFSERPQTEANSLFLDFLAGNTYDLEIDGQGRIAIPQALIEMAKFNREVYVVGRLHKIVIWEASRYKTFEEKAFSCYKELARKHL